MGKITDYVKNKSNPIFVIEHITGKEIFVPAASDLLEKIDEMKRRAEGGGAEEEREGERRQNEEEKRNR